MREIADRRRSDLDDALEIWKTALADNAELMSAYRDYQLQAIQKAEGKANDLDKARETLKAALARAGLEKNVLEPPYRCELCHDTGYHGGGYCRCVVKQVISADPENLTLPPTDFNAACETAPKAMKKCYLSAREYIDGYDGGKPFFVIVGSPGIGKTVLLSAIATAFLEKGASAVTVGAFDFLRRAKEYHTQFAIDDYVDRFTPMLDCDLLCIDDLGTETILKNVTREYLYNVINERWLKKKYTAVTTNLSYPQLVEKYGESIVSRLLDKNRATAFSITGTDKRLK